MESDFWQFAAPAINFAIIMLLLIGGQQYRSRLEAERQAHRATRRRLADVEDLRRMGVVLIASDGHVIRINTKTGVAEFDGLKYSIDFLAGGIETEPGTAIMCRREGDKIECSKIKVIPLIGGKFEQYIEPSGLVVPLFGSLAPADEIPPMIREHLGDLVELGQPVQTMHGDWKIDPSWKSETQALRDALTAHHQWHAAQTEEDEHGIILADAYSESALYEQTVNALSMRQSGNMANAASQEEAERVARYLDPIKPDNRNGGRAS